MPRLQRFPEILEGSGDCGYCKDDGLITIKTTGPVAGTTTLPIRPGGDTTVIVTETPGGDTTITTTGPTPGTTTLPARYGGDTTVIVTENPDGDVTITETGTEPGTTTLPASSGDETTVIVTVDPDLTTTTVTGEDPGTTTLPIESGDGTTTEDTTVVVTVTSMTSGGGGGGLLTSEATEEGTTTQSSDGTPTNTPSQNCPDLENGDFFVNGDGTLPPWYISDQVTADSSGVIAVAPDGTTSEAAFALIPSQAEFSQVYLNQQLPSCGDPPPEVTLTIRFNYQFTGVSTGCRIGASVNRSPDNIVDIQDDGSSPGVWQMYEGEPIQVQLTYDPLFTLKLSCDADVANQPAILITDISVY